jgi:4-oxalocrotonate tautomerase
MPIVTIQVTREGTSPGANSVTAEEKAALIKGASELLRDVLNKPLESTFVVIEEVDTDNWGWAACPRWNFGAAGPQRAAEAPALTHDTGE